jgi:hypothetical protein
MDRLRFRTARHVETEATPIRYVAEPIGADTDSEQAIRWPTHGAVCAIALTAASAINNRLKPNLVRSTFESCRARAIDGHSC